MGFTGCLRTFQVSNVGAQPLALEAVAFATSGQGFTVAFAGELPRTLLPGEWLDLTVTFDPMAAPAGDVFTDSLLVMHDAPRWASRLGLASPAFVSLVARREPAGVEDSAGGWIHEDRLTVRAWPNPFSGKVTLDFRTAVAGSDAPGAAVRWEVVDVTGRRVRTIRSVAPMAAVSWDGRDDRGVRLPAGIYFVRGQAGLLRGSCAVALME